MTEPSSRRPRRTSRPDRASVPRGRRAPRTGTPTTGPGRRVRAPRTPAAAGTPQSLEPGLASSKIARQLAVLGLVLAVVAISLAYPLRSYLQQRSDLAAAVAHQHQLEQQIVELQIQQAALADPDYIRAAAKERLQYVKPGDTVYVVQAPDLTSPTAGAGGAAAQPGPWYATLWDTLAADSGPAVDPSVLDPAATAGANPGSSAPEPEPTPAASAPATP